MAISKSFFAPRRGSTKSSTYQLYRGQQVTKDRVQDVSNPQTSAQGLQRMRVAAVSNAAARLRPLISQSFEGVPYGEESVREFMRVNLAKNGPCHFQCYPKKGENTPGLSTLMVSRGSLPSLNVMVIQETEENMPVLYFKSTLEKVPTSALTNEEAREIWIQVFKNAFGLKDNDQVTILSQMGLSMPTVREDGYTHDYLYKPGIGYAISRLVLNTDSPITKRWIFTTSGIYTPQFSSVAQLTDGITSIAVVANGNDIACLIYPTNQAFSKAGLEGHKTLDTGTIILSRKENGRWLRSTQVLPANPTPGYILSADDAWPSYIKSSASKKYLNAGSENVSIIGG